MFADVVLHKLLSIHASIVDRKAKQGTKDKCSPGCIAEPSAADTKDSQVFAFRNRVSEHCCIRNCMAKMMCKSMRAKETPQTKSLDYVGSSGQVPRLPVGC